LLLQTHETYTLTLSRGHPQRKAILFREDSDRVENEYIRGRGAQTDTQCGRRFRYAKS
jgi:hypothetical protein